MREFNVPLYIFIYFSRVLNQSARVKKQRESRKAAQHAYHSPIVRFSCCRQDSRHLTNVVEAEFAEYRKPVAPSCIEIASDMRSPTGRKFRAEL